MSTSVRVGFFIFEIPQAVPKDLPAAVAAARPES
jgi:hypothetical protein